MTLDSLRALLDQASEGPWTIDECDDVRVSGDDRLIYGEFGYDASFRTSADAKLVTALRNAAPALIAVAELADQFCSSELAPSGVARMYQNLLSQKLAQLEAL